MRMRVWGGVTGVLLAAATPACPEGSVGGAGDLGIPLDGETEASEGGAEAPDAADLPGPDPSPSQDTWAPDAPDGPPAPSCEDDDEPCTVDGRGPDGACQHLWLLDCCHADADCPVQPVCNGLVTCDVAASRCVKGPAPENCCATAAECNDLNKCNGDEWCKGHTCQAGVPLACDEDEPCLEWTCTPDGGCSALVPSCDDEDACTEDFCDVGEGCKHGPPVSYDDGDPCNGLETCDPATGGYQAGSPLACDDGDPCNGKEACEAGSAGCVVVASPPSCDNGLSCDGKEVCEPMKGCASGPPPAECCTSLADCEDANPCNGILTCNLGTGQCEVKVAPLPCDDGNPCTTESCDPLAGCVGGPPMSCDDENLCNGAEVCDPQVGCVPSGGPPPCSDGKFCNGAEWCHPKSGCQPGKQVVCSDGNLCNGLEACDDQAGACQNGVVLGCNDGLACNGTESCDPVVGCLVGAPIGEPCCHLTAECEDGNPCNGQWSCDPESQLCAKIADPLACDDGNACNDVDYCDPAKGCVQNPGPVCDDGNLCDGLESCDPEVGCQKGAPPECEDGNPCNGSKACHPLQGCVPAEPAPTCVDGNPCTVDGGCDLRVGCQYKAITEGPCDDGKPCTTGETCQGGQCSVAVTYACDDGLGCTQDACDGGGGCLPPKPMAGWCALGGACVEAGTKHSFNSCLSCQPQKATTAWSPVADGSSCPPGPQTLAAQCVAGLCVPEPDMCKPGWAECEPWVAGCETATWSDPGACSECGETCAAGQVCAQGACASSCGSLTDCGGACADLATHPQHCGGCGQACDAAHQTGACEAGQCGCEAGWSDANGEAPDGCECAPDGTPGACGMGCAVCDGGGVTEVATCVGGACAKSKCGPGVLDQDGAWQNGCEAACAPVPEACDGLDNDCNGLVDDALCDDGVACTVDACDAAAGGCASTPDDGACQDAGPCAASTCHAELGCLTTSLEGAACDDAEPCTHGDTCVGSACEGTPAGCDDGLACTADACDGQGGCAAATVQAGWCLLKGACVAAGTGAPQNPCLACQPAIGAKSWTLLAEGSGCPAPAYALAGECQAGVCVPGVGSCEPGWLDCEPWGAGCETAGWSDPRHCGTCEEGCGATEVCSAGECAAACGAGLVACGQACAELGTHPLHCGSCGVACDGPQESGVCAGGACACKDGYGDADGLAWNGCECVESNLGVELCNGVDDDCDGVTDDVALGQANTPGGCGLACTVCPGGDARHYATCANAVCGLGDCPPGLLDLDGGWQNACEAPCAPSGPEVCDGLDNDCTGVADDGLCGDGVACTVDTCDPATEACAHAPDNASCVDENPCTADVCDASLGCTHPALDTAPCDDGDPCSFADECLGTACVGVAVGPACCHGDDAECDDGYPCTADSCDAATSKCAFVAVADGTACADGNGCTLGDACASGWCTPGKAVDCSPADPCKGVCVPAAGEGAYTCEESALPASTWCDDGDPCTSGDHCLGGACQAGPDEYDCGVAPGDCWVKESCTPSGCVLAAKPEGTACDLLGSGGCATESVCDGEGQCLASELCPELMVAQNGGNNQDQLSVVARGDVLHFGFRSAAAPWDIRVPATITRGYGFDVVRPETAHTSTSVGVVKTHALEDGRWLLAWSAGSTLSTRKMCHDDSGTCPGGIAQGAPMEGAVSRNLGVTPSSWELWPQSGGYTLVAYGYQSDVYARRFAPGGEALQTSAVSYTPYSNSAGNPFLRPIQDGTLGLVVWEQDDALWQQRIEPDGEPVGLPAAVSEPGDFWLNDVTAVGPATWLVAYTRPSSAGVTVARVQYPDIVEKRVDLGVVGDPVPRGWDASLALLADGNLALCFYSDGTGAQRQWYRMVTSSLLPVGDPVLVGVVSLNGSDLRCTAMPAPGSRFVATWITYAFPGGHWDDVVARIIDPCVAEGACTGYLCASDSECDDANACTMDACDLAAGTCTQTAVPDYAACQDGDGCTQGDFCLGTACLPGPAVDCSGANPCVGACVAGPGPDDYSCDPVSLPPSTPCEDGDPCTSGDYCLAGSCQTGPDPYQCAGPGECRTGTCTPVGCEYTALPAGTACYLIGAGGCAQDGHCDDAEQCVLEEACPELVLTQGVWETQSNPWPVPLGDTLHFGFGSRAPSFGSSTSPMTVSRDLGFGVVAPETQHALATSGVQAHPLPDGNWTIVWSNGSALYTRWMCHSDTGSCAGGIPSGAPMSSAVKRDLGVTPGSWDLLPQPEGYALVAYASANDVWAQRFSPAGDALSAEPNLYTWGSSSAWNPRVRRITEAEALLVWQQDDALWQQRVAPSGLALGLASKVLAAQVTLEDVVVLDEWTWLVAYTRPNNVASGVVRVTYPDVAGTAQDLAKVGTVAKGWGARLAPFDDGSFVLCFHSDGVATERTWFLRVGADLAAVGAPEAVAAITKNSASAVRCRALPGPGKRFVAAWATGSYPGGHWDDVVARVLTW